MDTLIDLKRPSKRLKLDENTRGTCLGDNYDEIGTRDELKTEKTEFYGGENGGSLEDENGACSRREGAHSGGLMRNCSARPTAQPGSNPDQFELGTRKDLEFNGGI